MPDEDDLTEMQQASADLDQGLKSCRAVVRDYRAMLSGGADYPESFGHDDDTSQPGDL